jgi:hypothetical protein
MQNMKSYKTHNYQRIKAVTIYKQNVHIICQYQ